MSANVVPAVARASQVNPSAGPVIRASVENAATSAYTSTPASTIAVAKWAVTSSAARSPFTTIPPSPAWANTSATASHAVRKTRGVFR